MTLSDRNIRIVLAALFPFVMIWAAADGAWVSIREAFDCMRYWWQHPDKTRWGKRND